MQDQISQIGTPIVNFILAIANLLVTDKGNTGVVVILIVVFALFFAAIFSYKFYHRRKAVNWLRTHITSRADKQTFAHDFSDICSEIDKDSQNKNQHSLRDCWEKYCDTLIPPPPHNHNPIIRQTILMNPFTPQCARRIFSM